MIKVLHRSEMPIVSIHVDEFFNFYYHVTGLFPESFGPFSLQRCSIDPRHNDKYGHVKTRSSEEAMRTLSGLGWASRDPLEVKLLLKCETPPIDSYGGALAWRELYTETIESFRSIWRSELREKLSLYAEKFSMAWDPISEDVLMNLSRFSKGSWPLPQIDIYVIDCLRGGTNTSAGVIIPSNPDLDVEKKLLTHELAHLLVSESSIRDLLKTLGLRIGGLNDTAHAIVDYIAYISARDHFVNPSRKGLKPNPDYFEEEFDLYQAFEEYAKTSSSYDTLENFVMYAVNQFPRRRP
ncbi:MAG TPA: hypothetical protein VNA15_09685 [Candidatus Angelobacter sp.]|nr:hypothetical protein [Candidatus Angelobacter sp.]